MAALKNFNRISEYFSYSIKNALNRIKEDEKKKCHEIRLRLGRPVSIVSYGKEKYLSKDGRLTDFISDKILVTQNDIDFSFKAVCDYSIHSYSRELSEGFITIAGGNRVGIAGTAVIKDNRVNTIKYINGLNFRIANEVKGCSEGLCNQLFAGEPVGVLIGGSPGSGKTTYIRDLCRLLSKRWRVSVIDERCEIAATYHGEPQNDIGYRTDVFDGYPKAYGIQTAIRVMNPDFIICDEIGNDEDCKALLNTLNAGVKIIATAHCGNSDDLLNRKHIKKLINRGAFDYIAILGNGNEIGNIKDIKSVSKKAGYKNVV